MAESPDHTQGRLNRRQLQGRNSIMISIAEIKLAIERDDPSIVQQVHSFINDPIIVEMRSGEEPLARTPLQYAISKGSEKVVKALIGAGARYDGVIPNDFTDTLLKHNAEVHGFFESMRAFCDKKREGETDFTLNKLKLKMREDFDQIQRDHRKGKLSISAGASGVEKSRIDMLWDVMNQHFLDAEAFNGNFDELSTEFLSYVALLASPLNQIEAKSRAAYESKLPKGKNPQAGSAEKKQPAKVSPEVETARREQQAAIKKLSGKLHGSSSGVIGDQARKIIQLRLGHISAQESPTTAQLANCVLIAELSPLSWQVLGKLQNAWYNAGLRKIEDIELRNLPILRDTNFVKFLVDIFQKVDACTIKADSPEYVNMLTALHTFLQHNPELDDYPLSISPSQMMPSTIDGAVIIATDSDKMQSVSAQINVLFHVSEPIVPTTSESGLEAGGSSGPALAVTLDRGKVIPSDDDEEGTAHDGSLFSRPSTPPPTQPLSFMSSILENEDPRFTPKRPVPMVPSSSSLLRSRNTSGTPKFTHSSAPTDLDLDWVEIETDANPNPATGRRPFPPLPMPTHPNTGLGQPRPIPIVPSSSSVPGSGNTGGIPTFTHSEPAKSAGAGAGLFDLDWDEFNPHELTPLDSHPGAAKGPTPSSSSSTGANTDPAGQPPKPQNDPKPAPPAGPPHSGSSGGKPPLRDDTVRTKRDYQEREDGSKSPRIMDTLTHSFAPGGEEREGGARPGRVVERKHPNSTDASGKGNPIPIPAPIPTPMPASSSASTGANTDPKQKDTDALLPGIREIIDSPPRPSSGKGKEKSRAKEGRAVKTERLAQAKPLTAANYSLILVDDLPKNPTQKGIIFLNRQGGYITRNEGVVGSIISGTVNINIPQNTTKVPKKQIQPILRKILADNPSLVTGGIVDVISPPAAAPATEDFSGLSSLYFATEKVKTHLDTVDNGYEHISAPEFREFKKLSRFKANGFEGIKFGDKTIWQTLNPEGRFQVQSWIEPAVPGQKSELELAEDKHIAYRTTFKAKLSTAGGIYHPPGNKKYYFERNADGSYDLMLKPKQTLTQDELLEATRQLVVITRDMEDKIDVSVHIYDESLKHEAEELAATIVALGATMAKSKPAEATGESAHSIVERRATKMQETAIAPEFRDIAKQQKTLWETVRKSEKGKERAVQTEVIEQTVRNKYRLMSAAGGVEPTVDETPVDQRAYWTTVAELEKKPEFSCVSAVTTLTNVLQNMENPEGIADGIAAHLVPIEKTYMGRYEEQSQTIRQKWEEESKTLRRERRERFTQYSSDSEFSETENLAQSSDEEEFSQRQTWESFTDSTRDFPSSVNPSSVDDDRHDSSQDGALDSTLTQSQSVDAVDLEPVAPQSQSSVPASVSHRSSRSKASSGRNIETLSDGNCVLHTVVLVLKDQFKELQLSAGYKEFERAFEDWKEDKLGKGWSELAYMEGLNSRSISPEDLMVLASFLDGDNPDRSLKAFLELDSQLVQKVLSPIILRPLAVNWWLSDPNLARSIVTAWKKLATNDSGEPIEFEITAESLKNIDVLNIESLTLESELVDLIRGASWEDGEEAALIRIVEDRIIHKIKTCYEKTTANLPAEVAAVVWDRLATNVELTRIHESSTGRPIVLLKGADERKNVEIRMVQKPVRDGSSRDQNRNIVSYHYDARIINAARPEEERQQDSRSHLSSNPHAFTTFSHPSEGSEFASRKRRESVSSVSSQSSTAAPTQPSSVTLSIKRNEKDKSQETDTTPTRPFHSHS